jgi:hypothetical protein
MTKLALSEPFSVAKSKAYCAVGLCAYIAGRAYDPDCSQIKKTTQTSLVSDAIADLLNPLIRYAHHHVIDDMLEKAATGDHAPKPDLKEALLGLTKIATQQVSRLTPYANQVIRNQILNRNGLITTTGAIALLGISAYIFTTTTREDFEQAVQKTAFNMAVSANKIEDRLADTIETMPLPAYTPHKINV